MSYLFRLEVYFGQLRMVENQIKQLHELRRDDLSAQSDADLKTHHELLRATGEVRDVLLHKIKLEINKQIVEGTA